MENICIKNETKIVDFTYSHRRGGNLQHCKGEKQKRHFINFIISMNFLADSLRDQKDSSKNLNVGQKTCLQTLHRHNKYVCSCKSLPSIVLSLQRQNTLYSPSCWSAVDANINFPSLLQIISSLSVSVLLILHKKTNFLLQIFSIFSFSVLLLHKKKLFSFSKYFPYFPSPNIVLLFLLRSSSSLQTKYYPPFPSVFFSSSANQNISFSILLLLFYCQHLHNKDRSINKRFAFYT